MTEALEVGERQASDRVIWPPPRTPGPPGVTPEQWGDWSWQMRQRIRSAASLREWIEPTPEEESAIEALAARFRFVITPY
ncbi:MAG: hypothetical protein JRG86_10275, partial [Deltaproteobacteria bacterium]|nr:hypothetical protein [Deltaproteobacteria bacterium]